MIVESAGEVVGNSCPFKYYTLRKVILNLQNNITEMTKHLLQVGNSHHFPDSYDFQILTLRLLKYLNRNSDLTKQSSSFFKLKGLTINPK